jgi:phage FluMu gp28-like protein
MNPQEPLGPLLSYEEFRTGLTYADVYHIIYARPWKRRRGVLGAWREIKQKMYREYVEMYTYYQQQRK